MIKISQDLPPNVRGYAIIGELEAEDYRILRPYLSRAAKRLTVGINLLVDATEASGLSTKALWEEMKLEWQRAGNINRVALIGTPLWTKPFVKLANMIRIGSEVRTFKPEEKNEAIGWLAGMIAYQ